MSKHTPGEWTVERYGDGNLRVIHSDSMSRICFMATPGSHGDPAMIEADAALIAAAPSLLDALQELADAADEVGVNRFDTDTMDPDVQAMQMATQEARAAIAKARGE